jgi:threonine dehydratase
MQCTHSSKNSQTNIHTNNNTTKKIGLGMVPGSKEARAVLDAINAAPGFEAQDVSDVELAQLHIRHLVGGQLPGPRNGAAGEERLFQVTYPERKGMLRALLAPLSPRWNVTLLHFRKTGSRQANALLGLQLPAAEVADFRAAVAALNDDFHVDELAGAALSVARMFLGGNGGNGGGGAGANGNGAK